MYTRGESAVDFDLLRRVADEGLETDAGRFPAAMHALMRQGYVKEAAVGTGGYVCWKITKRGLEALGRDA